MFFLKHGRKVINKKFIYLKEAFSSKLVVKVMEPVVIKFITKGR